MSEHPNGWDTAMSEEIARLNAALSDRYRVERELGRGGMAIVYLAHDQKLGRQVALKVLRPELASSIGAERFLREIEIAARLNHPHILALLDCGSIEQPSHAPPLPELLYYTMPYIEGESLRDRLNRERQLQIDDALRITREVADALGYAHTRGLVHRDIKPENILFQAGHAVVSDFGIAKAVAAAGGAKLTETGIAVGTPEYMSPEQGVDSGEVDARSDIYSLGCVLYEMLSGDAPYTASTPQALIAKKLSEPTPRISVVRETVPPQVEAAVIKALEKAPADRFATAQQFVEALAAPREGITPVERPEPVAAEQGKRAWRWAVGVVATAVVVVAGLMLLERIPSRTDSSLEASEIERLVVAPLENRTGDPAAADWAFMAAEYVTRTLDRASVATVVPASTVRDLVREVDPATGMPVEEIARRTGARYAIIGSYSTSAGRLRFDVEVVDVESGELLRALDPITGPVDSLQAAFALLAERVTVAAMAVLGGELDPVWARMSSPPSADIMTRLLATQDFFCRFRFQDVIDAAQPALEEAPDFAPLLMQVLFSYLNLGRYREADSVFALIEALGDQLTSSERLLTSWSHAYFYGSDPTEETRIAEQLFRIQPSTYGYHAGLTALRTNRFEDALERLLACDIDTPCYRVYFHWWYLAAEAYHMLGRYEDELTIARDGLQRFPSFRPLIRFEAEALAGLGRLDAVDSLLDVIADLPPQPRAWDIYNPGSQTAYIALELNVLGQQEASERLMDRALAWFETRPASELRFERAQTLYWAERWSDADTLFAALMAETPDNFDYRGFRGVALAHLGRRDEALETARWLEQLDRPYLRGAHTRWRAAIAAALGDREGAVRLLEQAYHEGMRLGHDHQREPEWRPLYDYRPYQESVRPR
jgi:serine/threonine protein kinase/tetratricopeptide (TPR) repeat protein